MKRACLLLVLALVVGNPAPGWADRKTARDRNDVSGVLDIRTVSHGHGRNGKLVHTVRMFEDWPPSALELQESWIALLFDVKRNEFNDNRYLRIDYTEEDGLYARMYRQGISGPGEFIGDVPVSRPSESSVKVKFPKRFLKKRLKQYRWRAIASYEDDGECSSEEDSADQGGCLDYIPPPRKPGIRHDVR